MRRALFPSEVAASTPIGLSVPRFPAPHTLAAFSIRPRIHFGRLPRLDFHTLPATTVRRSAAPIPSGQTGLDASRQAQFSAGIVILCGVRREPPTSAGSDPATGGTDQSRTGGLLIPNQARYQLRYGSILAADGGVEPHGFHRALLSRQAPRPLEFICRIGWRFCTMHDQESNLTVWGLKPRCTSKDDRHPILRGIGHHHAMSLCRISLFVRFSVSQQTPHLNAHSMRI